jgi:unsaturated chondroitin disaccharide hydrolase
MMRINPDVTAVDLLPGIDVLWEASGAKIRSLTREYDRSRGSPVFTEAGRYTSRGWTEWTQGFEYGSRLLQFDATGEREFFDSAVADIVGQMAPHVTHMGVHDHGFNNVSTYGNLLRLVREGRAPDAPWCREFCELALKCSGAVQAARWTPTRGGGGYLYSFNGPHSLFADTIRSLRALAVAHQLGHRLMGENDKAISLLDRLVQHAKSTADFAVYYGEGRDSYDVRGRVAHESVFNTNDGAYRCPNSQQGYSPFSTWTRGLAWIMCGYAEELAFIASLDAGALDAHGGRDAVLGWMLRAAKASCDFYLENTALDGVPYWDTGAPELHRLGDWRARPAEPFNAHEPVDSSAAAIAAQGLLRLGRYLGDNGDAKAGAHYWQAGLTVVQTLLGKTYLNRDAGHQGLIVHSVYHRPNGWDHVPSGQRVPCGESSMWGDYHMREVALYVQRVAKGETELRFFL